MSSVACMRVESSPLPLGVLFRSSSTNSNTMTQFWRKPERPIHRGQRTSLNAIGWTHSHVLPLHEAMMRRSAMPVVSPGGESALEHYAAYLHDTADLRPATLRNYLSDLRQFAAWCEE